MLGNYLVSPTITVLLDQRDTTIYLLSSSYKPIFKTHLVPMKLTALSRSCGTERNVLVYFLALQPPCIVSHFLNLGHPRISVSLILTGTPERPLSGPDLLGASTKHSQLRHKWTSCLSPLSPSSYQGPGCLSVLHAVWVLSWVRVWEASGQAGVRKPLPGPLQL